MQPHPEPLAVPITAMQATKKWIRQFPLLPSKANFAHARAVHQRLLTGRPAAAADADIEAWLRAMPAAADLSFCPLYPETYVPRDQQVLPAAKTAP